jgi:hypothetical protein
VSDLDQAKPPNGVRSPVAKFSIVIATRRCPPAILCPTVYLVSVSTLFGLNSHVSGVYLIADAEEVREATKTLTSLISTFGKCGGPAHRQPHMGIGSTSDHNGPSQ